MEQAESLNMFFVKLIAELLMKLHLRATQCHLPYGITVLPATWHK